MGCAQSTLQDPGVNKQQNRDVASSKPTDTGVETAPAVTADGAAAAPAAEGQPQGTPSTATPYNRAKDRVDAIPESKNVIINGVQMQYAYVSQRGFYPDEPFKANQDAYCVKFGVGHQKDDALFAVFDGHGKDGDGCAIYSKEHLHKNLSKHLDTEKFELTKDQTHAVLRKSHLETNAQLRADKTVDDSLSGTTAVSIYFHGRRNRVTVSNLGDSRVVLGQRVEANGSSKLVARPLSRDQTPYRKDEKLRIRATGARVLSLDQLEGLEPIEGSENDAAGGEMVLGEEIDEGGDPPRVWHATEDYPGTAFTRSIGDGLAEELGVYADPEMLSREMESSDEILVVASDGVYEFLTNQSVIDICAKFSDPLEACRAVVAEAYELWLQYELRTDDITIICIFIKNVTPDLPAPGNRRGSLLGDTTEVAAAACAVEDPSSHEEEPEHCHDDCIDNAALILPMEGFKPVRNNVSKAKSKEIERLKKTGEQLYKEDQTFDLSQLATFKNAEEKGAIADAIKASNMFKNVTDEQRELVYSCMESIKVKAGTWVIRQGTVGDRFYIADDGIFEVRIVPDGEKDTGNGGHIIHQYHGSRKDHAHPSFGELALMHSAPRSASIIAKTDGHLWALHRAAFRQILIQAQDHRKDLKVALAKIPYFSGLDSTGLSKLAAIMEDITFGRGDNITEQGRLGEKIYVLESGSAYKTAILPSGETLRENLKSGSYFGTELLDGIKHSYTGTIMAMQTTTCWMLDVPLMHQTMGPLLEKNKSKKAANSEAASAASSS